ncbi:gas vesicle protein [Pseudomonas fluorescens]|jgi:hypothetical protein|uniref:Gas vesicle protein n=1 Tax=Pseudomonas fluorescens TaxID=294 RepID=A0A2N1DXX8_PSEFL|nr:MULTISPECIES: gas vesicle accessory protein GvpU [Pseudomonas]MBD8099398.1 gas vesicle protein [Pseudomonas fluorescens]MBD8775428.1 gas vesicle protein [Pseudomonas fluorescens]MBD8781469.1 gas vesicle protein [Pseudomonas fluorescens]MBD8794609.1 gas vesicle protein [Pseudomonas fluorescens]PKH15697.1 gas vesicle protein [Pseudomonas fluorescens]
MQESQDQTKTVVEELDLLNDKAFTKTQWEGRQTDWLLQWLVRSSNQASLSIGVTLSVGGSVISGKLIPHAVYFERLAESFSAPFREKGDHNADAIQDIILGFNVTPESESSEEDAPFQFLHLENARTYLGTSSPIPGEPGALWRGKISSVDGFTLGTISNND